MVSRIVDLLFIQTLRAWAAGPDARPSWITAAMDPLLGRALTAIHRTPAHPWTVDSLAEAAGLSRSTFADRFTRSVGQPPAEYLIRHRLDLARGLLRESDLPVRAVAARVGYTSEAAFSRAFRRRFGDSPLHWRRQHRGVRVPGRGET
jgi:transcriptional regulator GlxA family with amidase domain